MKQQMDNETMSMQSFLCRLALEKQARIANVVEDNAKRHHHYDNRGDCCVPVIRTPSNSSRRHRSYDTRWDDSLEFSELQLEDLMIASPTSPTVIASPMSPQRRNSLELALSKNPRQLAMPNKNSKSNCLGPPSIPLKVDY